MPKERLRISNADGGALMEIATQKLDEIAADVVNRPDVPKPRKLVITVELAPNLIEHTDDLDSLRNIPSIDYSVKTIYPGVVGAQSRAATEITAEGEEVLIVNTNYPEATDADQSKMFDKSKEKKINA